jgi:hypothetical protein
MTSGKFDASKSFIPTALVGFSLDFSIGKGSIETSAGLSKYLSIGALWDFNNKSGVDFGGISLHIGPGVSLPCVPFPGL